MPIEIVTNDCDVKKLIIGYSSSFKTTIAFGQPTLSGRDPMRGLTKFCLQQLSGLQYVFKIGGCATDENTR